MLALSGGLSWPWVESRYSKHPTGPSSGHSLHRAQGRGERKEQKAGGEQGEPWHGTSCRSSSSAPGASFTITAKAIGELVSCPPPPQPSRGLWMPDSHDPCTPEGALGVPWVLSAATCAEEGEKRLAPGSVSMGGLRFGPPQPRLWLGQTLPSWVPGVLGRAPAHALQHAAGVSGVSGQGCPRARQRGQGLRWELKALWGDKGLMRSCSALSDPSAHYLIRAGCLAGHGVE